MRCLVRDAERSDALPDDPRLEIVEGSLDADDDVFAALDGIDTVVHVAHIRFAPALIDIMTETGRQYRLISISSTRLFSRFVTTLREVVREGEEAICQAPPSIRWTILRPSMVFGGTEDNNIERIARFLRRCRLFPIFGSGQNLVQPTFVWDLVDAIEKCLENPRAEERCYTLAGPEPMTYRDMVRAIARAAGLPTPVFVRLPLKPSVFAAQVLSWVWDGLPAEAVQRFDEDRSFLTTPAERDLGFHPTPFEEALERKFRDNA